MIAASQSTLACQVGSDWNLRVDDGPHPLDVSHLRGCTFTMFYRALTRIQHFFEANFFGNWTKWHIFSKSHPCSIIIARSFDGFGPCLLPARAWPSLSRRAVLPPQNCWLMSCVPRRGEGHGLGAKFAANNSGHKNSVMSCPFFVLIHC